MQKHKTTLEQRNKIIAMILKTKDPLMTEANACAKFIGFNEAITAEFFEHVIAKDGLHGQVIAAISKFYSDETKEVISKAEQ